MESLLTILGVICIVGTLATVIIAGAMYSDNTIRGYEAVAWIVMWPILLLIFVFKSCKKTLINLLEDDL